VRTNKSTAIWIDPGLGVSGDMMLGALVGLGADLATIRAELESLAVDGWTITESQTKRCGLSATRVEVSCEDSAHHRAWSTIDEMIASSGLSDFVKTGARRTFRRLGEVEANQHQVAIDEVHFHEVGAIDAIVDIVGAWIGLDLLGVQQVHCGPVGLGGGTTTSAHGVIPLPAPATVGLLTGFAVRGLDIEGETATPTGAALVTTMATVFGPMPKGVVVATARGAGGRNPETHPNATTAVLVDVTAADATAALGDAGGSMALELVSNIDDVTPEVLGYVIGRLLEEGADDAWVVPIQMKKNRPAHQLRVLTSVELAPTLRDLISAETGTLGIRQFGVTKFPLPRETRTIELRGCDVRIKVGPHGMKPEHDDLVHIAAKVKLPLKQLAAEAVALAERI